MSAVVVSSRPAVLFQGAMSSEMDGQRSSALSKGSRSGTASTSTESRTMQNMEVLRCQAMIQQTSRLSLNQGARASQSSERRHEQPAIRRRYELQLRSFESLGVCRLIPGPLPTPPDEFDPQERSLSLPSPSSDFSYLSDVSFVRHLPLTPMKPTTEAQQGLTEIAQAVAADSQLCIHDNPQLGLESIVELAVNNITKGMQSSSQPTISIMHQSQPCQPRKDDNVSCYRPLLQGLNQRLTTAPCFDVTKAISPSADGPVLQPQDGDDYFSLQVYPRVAYTPDHPDSSPSTKPSSSSKSSTRPAPLSPRPAVPPSTLHASILERFTPPPSTKEYWDLFSPTGPSALVDRLSELSPNDGTLIFTYPTASGASTFVNKSYHPLIDPLLRRVMQQYGLGWDFAERVARMPAAGQLDRFEALSEKVSHLLRSLSSKEDGERYKVLHAEATDVKLETGTWVQQWLCQEKQRVKAAVQAYAVERGMGGGVGSGNLVWSMLDGVEEMGKKKDVVEQDKVEVGMFVIVRTA